MYSKIGYKRFYRTKKDDVAKELIVPLLAHGTKYDRCTGFFSVQALSELASGLVPYVKNGGNIRIITSVKLGELEQVIIAKGEELAESIILPILEKLIDNEVLKPDVEVSMDLIANLIAAKRLAIKIGHIDGGIYHEKIGLFEDADGEKLCFVGSANETYNGLENNRETLYTLQSWQGDVDAIKEQEEYFENLWNNKDEAVRVFNVPDAIAKKLISRFDVSGSVDAALRRYVNAEKKTLKKKELYDYQKEAIKRFESNNYCHFFEMATGTGKTFTAVKALQQCYETHSKLFVSIIVPQIDLQIQWAKALKEENINCTLFGGATKEADWEEAYNRSVIEYYNSNLSVILSTYDTYFGKLAIKINALKAEKLIIVDEAHELSANQIGCLSESYRYRLGLSATPERHNQDETESIIRYFTREATETYKYSIDEAIGRFLCNYEYNPIFVQMSSDKFEQYQNYTKQLVTLFNQKERDYDAIREKSNKRSLIVKKTDSKLAKIREMILGDYNFQNAVVYCGQGKDEDSDESIIDIVTKYLSIDGHYSVSQFTSKTEDRDAVLREFEGGYYDTLVAIKCFDQGVDVPKLDKIYIMASDALQRQTVQRRGRVLRQCTETGKKLAYIYDLVVLPPKGVEEGIGVKSLLVSELRRVKEYSRLAVNVDSLNQIITGYESKYCISKEDYAHENENEEEQC